MAAKRKDRKWITLDPTLTDDASQSLRDSLRSRVVGQDEAIDSIVNMYEMYMAGMCPAGRPIANFLFLGPTGTGKTRTVEALAEALVHNSRAVIKIDCAEFQHSHELAKLVGSPPGYLGHRETHPMLSQERINQYHTETVKVSFVLFDEIEKASDALWNLLLGILDKATLTLGDNKKVDFSHCMIFMTSNLGAAEMAVMAKTKIGFVQPTVSSDDQLEKLASTGVEAARRKFTPEFMNRLDKVVTFKPLGKAELKRILDIELADVQARIIRGQESFYFRLDAAAQDHLLSEGTDARYGARHLKRAIERLITQPLARLIATRQVGKEDWVTVSHTGGKLRFRKEIALQGEEVA